MRRRFPLQQPGVRYLCEGGQETEILYKYGYDLPEFAMFPLLEDSDAAGALRAMYCRYLSVAARHGFVALMAGLDYRASPDWAAKLGYSLPALADMQLRAIDFLRDAAEPWRDRLPGVVIAGMIGPQGDAYQRNESVTAASAEAYHAVQMHHLRRAGVDLASAVTFNNIPEAIGVARAAATEDLPLAISFTLDSDARLASGPTLREAIEAVDDALGCDRPDFYGINCSHPAEFESALEPGDWLLRLRMLRPNAARMDKMALCELGHLESGDPADLGRRMGALARRYPHIDIWGGCCGTWDEHLERIATAVETAPQSLIRNCVSDSAVPAHSPTRPPKSYDAVRGRVEEPAGTEPKFGPRPNF